MTEKKPWGMKVTLVFYCEGLVDGDTVIKASQEADSQLDAHYSGALLEIVENEPQELMGT